MPGERCCWEFRYKKTGDGKGQKWTEQQGDPKRTQALVSLVPNQPWGYAGSCTPGRGPPRATDITGGLRGVAMDTTNQSPDGDQGHEHHEQTMLRPVLISRVSSFLLRDLQERVLYGSLTCCWPSCVNTDTGVGSWWRLLWGGCHNHLPSSHSPRSPALHQQPEISLSHQRNVQFVLLLGLHLGKPENLNSSAGWAIAQLCTESHGAGPGLPIKLQLGSHCQLVFSPSLLFQMIITG